MVPVWSISVFLPLWLSFPGFFLMGLLFDWSYSFLYKASVLHFGCLLLLPSSSAAFSLFSFSWGHCFIGLTFFFIKHLFTISLLCSSCLCHLQPFPSFFFLESLFYWSNIFLYQASVHHFPPLLLLPSSSAALSYFLCSWGHCFPFSFIKHPFLL